MASSQWVSWAQSRTKAPVRLLCFAHAGGGATLFRNWRTAFEDEIDIVPVVLPGRESRIREPAYTRMEDLIKPLLNAIAPYLDRPYALFGHSMGAAIAFEASRVLTESNVPAPVRLFVSSRWAPHVECRGRLLSTYSDEELIRTLARLGGTPQELLMDPDLLGLFLPSLRADFAVNEAYMVAEQGSLSCPVSAFVGDRDPDVNPADLWEWRRVTTGEFSRRVFPGGHFYLKDLHREVAILIREELQWSFNGGRPSDLNHGVAPFTT